MDNSPSIFERLSNWSRRSVTLKLISIGILILLMLIPSAMIKSLVQERMMLRNQSIEEVSSKWGSRQLVGGPVISIPYVVRTVDAKGATGYVTEYAHFLPDQLVVTGSLTPEKRSRGIYVVVLYNTRLHIAGNFNFLDFKPLGIPMEDFRFNDAFVSVGISDLKGVKGAIAFNWNDSLHTLNPGIVSGDIFNSGASFPVPIATDGRYSFAFDVDLNGSSALRFAPFGKETNVSITSAWSSPKFDGYVLPSNREVTDTGFTASWTMTQLNRNYPQQGRGAYINSGDGNVDQPVYFGLDGIEKDDRYASFGVSLILPVDEYLKTERSVKYCIMLIMITFISFFFVETLSERRIHAIQYLLVGFAICLFYVLLLSISEQLNFNSAYLISFVSILGLISYYASYVFADRKLTAIFTGLLAILYGFFYSLLQLEDYALLLGSIGLFIILAAIMYLTRKVQWYK